MNKIILASSSPRRKDLLSGLGIKFETDPSNYQEDMSLKMSPEKLAIYLSLGKAKDVAQKHKDSIVIAADTFCVLNGELLGKPGTKEEAICMLKNLSGNVHSVITGFTIIDTRTNEQTSKSVETKVYFRKISEKEIDAYVASGEPMDKAGAYAIQGFGGLFVEKIEGDYFNIVGLPIAPLYLELQKFGLDILK